MRESFPHRASQVWVTCLRSQLTVLQLRLENWLLTLGHYCFQHTVILNPYNSGSMLWFFCYLISKKRVKYQKDSHILIIIIIMCVWNLLISACPKYIHKMLELSPAGFWDSYSRQQPRTWLSSTVERFQNFLCLLLSCFNYFRGASSSAEFLH